MRRRHTDLWFLSATLILLFVSQVANAQKQNVDTREISSYAPYWYVDQQTDSFLEVQNHLNTQLILRPVLTLITGKSIDLEPMMVAPHATQRLSLKSCLELKFHGITGNGRWGNGSRANSLLGNAQLIPVAPRGATARDFAAWILTENPNERLGMVGSMFQIPSDVLSTTLDGLWWLPFEDTDVYFVLQNTSTIKTHVKVSIFVKGKIAKQKTIKLGPSAIELENISVDLGLKSPPALGGVTFEYESEEGQTLPGQVISRGILIQERRGLSVSYMLHESISNTNPSLISELQAPAAYFGKLANLTGRSKTYVHPHLLLRNTGKHSITVNAALYGKSVNGAQTKFELRPILVQAQSVVHVDLDEQRRRFKSALSDGVAGLQLTYNGNPTDVVADLLNIDTTGDFVLYDDVHNMYLHHSVLETGVSFNLAGNGQSFLILKNATNQPQRPRVVLSYENGKGHYEVKLNDLPAQQVVTIDIRHLRDSGIPDNNGQVLPATIDFGGSYILGDPGGLVASDPTFVFSATPLGDCDELNPNGCNDDIDRPFVGASCMVNSGPRTRGGDGPPTITGLNELWYFDGENPASYPTQITLTSSAGPPTTWRVTTGANKVVLSTLSGAQIDVSSNGSVFSSSVGDIRITASAGGQVSLPFPITSRVPDHLAMVDTHTDCNTVYGYDTRVTYAMEDQLGVSLPNTAVPVNEFFPTSVVNDFPATNWILAPPSGKLQSNHVFTDRISGFRIGPNTVPTPVCPPASGVPVQHVRQEWRIGSTVPGSGRRVQTDVLQKFTNGGDVSNIVTPAP